MVRAKILVDGYGLLRPCQMDKREYDESQVQLLW